MNKTSMSSYLVAMKPIVKKMIQELEKEFSYVSILGTDTVGTDFSVRSKSISVADSNWNERGFVVRFYHHSFYSEFSMNQLNENNYMNYINLIINHSQEANRESFQTTTYPLLSEEELSGEWKSDVSVPFEELNTDTIVKKLTDIKDQIHHISPLVVNAGVNLQTVKVSKLFVSSKKDLMQAYTWSDCFMFACVQKEDKYRMGFKVSSGMQGAEILEHLTVETTSVVEDAIKLLDSERIVPGEYEVICSPDVAGLIAHEAFGHGVEMDMFVKNRAKAKEYMNKPVASPLVEMHDGAKSIKHLSSYWFDDEGTLGTDTTIIRQGILQSGINDLLSSQQLHTPPTGNGKRESFEKKAYARMTNTFFSPGKNTLEEMIQSIDDGFLLDQAESGMEDPKNWGIQCVAKSGREIKNGCLTGKVVSPVIITGYVPDLLSSISMVSGDLQLEGSGACGKGHKEYVKVSAGGPFIKVKARLS